VTLPSATDSKRRDELLEKAYEYVLAEGLARMSLRPLAAAVGSSPRVLLYLFGSKDALVQALLARARADELAFLERFSAGAGETDLRTTAHLVWDWLVAPEHRGLLALWLEAYARSLIDTDGPWHRFAALTVEDWLSLLASHQPASARRTKAGAAERTFVLAMLRGAFMDLLATGDADRVTRAVRLGLGKA
jgi:AcrR family transcriptional regulator